MDGEFPAIRCENTGDHGVQPWLTTTHRNGENAAVSRTMRFPLLIAFLSVTLSAATAAAVEADLEKAKTWWAFQPLRRIVVPPAVREGNWCRNEIDRFI